MLQYIVMLILALWLVFPDMLGKGKQGIMSTVVIELTPESNELDGEAINHALYEIDEVDHSSIVMISKDEALKLMSKEIDMAMLSRVERKNPFRDVIKFDLIKDINIDLSEFNNIAGIHKIPKSKSGNLSISKWSWKLAIPITLITVLIFYLYFTSLSKEIIKRIKKQITSLRLYGSSPVYIKQMITKPLRGESIKAWFLALLLFITSIYLILGTLGYGFSDISIVKLCVASVLSICLAIVTKHITVSKAISDQTK